MTYTSTVTWFLNDLKYSNDVRFFLSRIKVYEKSEHLGYINIFVLLVSLETHKLYETITYVIEHTDIGRSNFRPVFNINL